jgi:hypothetical protein
VRGQELIYTDIVAKNVKHFFNQYFPVSVVAILFLISFFIKFFRFSEFATYNAETGQHYLEIIKLLSGQFLVQGPLTSHSWLRLSSTPYYLFFPFFQLADFHPLTLPFLWTATSCLTILLSYLVVGKMYDRGTAVLASLLYLLSPNILILDRNSGFFPFIIPLMYLLIWQSDQFFFKGKGRLWVIFFLLSVMCTLHAAAIFVIPFYVAVIVVKKKIQRTDFLKSMIAFLIPQIPFLAIDATQYFFSTRQLLLWLPYKVFNFLSGKTLGIEKATVEDQTVVFISNFFKQFFFSPSVPWWIGIGVCSFFAIWLIVLLKKRIFSLETFLLSLLMFGTTALVIHKNPPQHYFVPIMILPLVLSARFLSLLWKNKKHRSLMIFFLTIIIGLSTRFIYSSQYLFAHGNNLGYETQLIIAERITRDARGQKFQLTRIGPFDHYQNGFKENYEYVLWWLGNRPIEDSLLEYIIVEDQSKLSPQQEIKTAAVQMINNINILKKETH